MKTRRILTTIIVLFTIIRVQFGQTSVSGRVLSQEDKQPLISSTVTVLKTATGELFTGALTDNEGRFYITGLPAGEYDFKFSYIGFATETKKVISGPLNKFLDLGNVFMTQSRVELSEVTVTGQKQINSATLDMKSYTAENFVSGSAGSVLDIMKTLPGIVIDQESRIVLRGSDKVAILIDGKQSSLTGFGSQKGLENIPASQIESIEIINNPSAKYDASGMAGIVNIKFRKSETKGFNGDAGFTPAIGMLTKRKPDLPTGMSSYSNNWKITPSLNLNYKTGKINLYWQSYVLNQKRLPNNEFTTRFYDNGNITESQVAENRSQNHYNLKLGMDWNPTANQTITFFGLYDYEWHHDTSRVWFFGNRDYQTAMRRWGFYESEGTGFANLTLQHKYRFKQPGHELNSQLLFTNGWEDETYNLSQNGPSPYAFINTDKTRVFAPEYIYLVSTDYIRPLAFGRIEAGVSGRLRNMPINYTVTKDPSNTALLYDFGNWSKWDEKLVGSYINLVAEFAKINIEAGLRGEYTGISYKFAPNPYFEEDEYDYFSFFPNTRFTYNINKSNKISLFYNRRVDRPGEDILRIFPKYDDPELLKIGNPSLRPQFTQNLELTYRYLWTNGSLYSSLYHKIIDNYFTRVYIQDPVNPEITIKAYDNLGMATNTGIESGIDQRITQAWKLSASINIYTNRIYAHEGTIRFPAEQTYSIKERKDIPLYFKITNQVTLPHDLAFELTGQYFTAKNIGQGRELSRGGLDFGMKKSFLSKKLEMNLTISDIFNTMGLRQRIEGQGFIAEYQNYFETQIFSLALRYKF